MAVPSLQVFASSAAMGVLRPRVVVVVEGTLILQAGVIGLKMHHMPC